MRSREIYFCPLDKPTKEQLAKRPQRLSSYCMNGAVNLFTAPTSAPPLNTTRVAQFPGTGVILWEQDEGAEGFWFNDGSKKPNESITNRHKGGAIVTCFDGHSEYMRWPEYEKELAKTPGRLWCNPRHPKRQIGPVPFLNLNHPPHDCILPSETLPLLALSHHGFHRRGLRDGRGASAR